MRGICEWTDKELWKLVCGYEAMKLFGNILWQICSVASEIVFGTNLSNWLFALNNKNNNFRRDIALSMERI